MARSAIRTQRLNLDAVNRMRSLFGTIKNTHRQLGLEGLVEYQTLYLAFHGLPITPDQKDKIEDSWSRWQLIYLRPEVPVSSDLALSSELLADLPEWLPKVTRTGKARAAV